MTTRSRISGFDLAAVGILAATALLTASLHARLPERVPTHFDVHGVADGSMQRALGAWLLPVTAGATWVLLRLGALLLPEAWRARLRASPVALATLLVVLLLCALQYIILYAALRSAPNVGMPLGFVLGGFWIALGLVLPRVRRNPWLGVRTPWTLSSDENWARTHRLAGSSFCLGGLVAIGCTLAGAMPVALLIVVVSALVPAVYSFVLARKLPPT